MLCREGSLAIKPRYAIKSSIQLAGDIRPFSMSMFFVQLWFVKEKRSHLEISAEIPAPTVSNDNRHCLVEFKDF